MANEPKFTITDGVVKVVDLETGQQVDRPDVAALGMQAFTQAVECAGGEIEPPVRLASMPLRLVRDDDSDDG